MLKRFGTLGASLLLICVGIGALVELGFVLFSKDHAARTTTYLPGAIFLIVFGVAYYLTFRLLGGWRASTWDGPNDGRKTLLFLLGLPGLIVGVVLLIFYIIIAAMGFWEDGQRVGYGSNKKKQPPAAPTEPAQVVQASVVPPAQAGGVPLVQPDAETDGPPPLQWQ
jgi:hypothetical protein